MALVTTTLSAAITDKSTSLTVASATGFAAGYRIQIDDEILYVAKNYSSGTTIYLNPRGADGTIVMAHVVSAKVICGDPADSEWGSVGAANAVQYPLAGRTRRRVSITATSSLTLPNPGEDMIVELNGTSVIALTVPVPTDGMTGNFLYVMANGAAAHTVTFTGGLSGAGSSYDVVTFNGTGPVTIGPFVAVNSLWQPVVAVPMAGTVTNVTATLT